MNNPFAFPRTGQNAPSNNGMTLRDWFATFAPEPSAIQIAIEQERDRIANRHRDKPQQRTDEEVAADIKFAYADAMLARRNR